MRREKHIIPKQLPTEGGIIITPSPFSGEIQLKCIECEETISNAKSIQKKFCNSCIKKHRYERVKRWKKENPEKEKEYQHTKHLKKAHSEGRFLRNEVKNCPICGEYIGDDNHIEYCKSCSLEREKQRSRIKCKKRYYRCRFHSDIENFFRLVDKHIEFNEESTVDNMINGSKKKNNIVLTSKELCNLFMFTFDRDNYKICKNCGCLISNAGKKRCKCDTCLKFYGFKNREEYLEYMRKYNLKRLGSSNIGSHRNVDFKREIKIVRLEKNKILKYGNGAAPFIKKYWKDNKRDSFEKGILGTRSEFKI